MRSIFIFLITLSICLTTHAATDGITATDTKSFSEQTKLTDKDIEDVKTLIPNYKPPEKQ